MPGATGATLRDNARRKKLSPGEFGERQSHSVAELGFLGHSLVGFFWELAKQLKKWLAFFYIDFTYFSLVCSHWTLDVIIFYNYSGFNPSEKK